MSVGNEATERAVVGEGRVLEGASPAGAAVEEVAVVEVVGAGVGGDRMESPFEVGAPFEERIEVGVRTVAGVDIAVGVGIGVDIAAAGVGAAAAVGAEAEVGIGVGIEEDVG